MQSCGDEVLRSVSLRVGVAVNRLAVGHVWCPQPAFESGGGDGIRTHEACA